MLHVDVPFGTVEIPGELREPLPLGIDRTTGNHPTLVGVEIAEITGEQSPIRELERGSMRVGSLGLILGTEAAPRCVGPDGGEAPPHHPPANIDDVDPVVAHFAIPKVPEPVPIVVDQVLVVGLLGGWSYPEIPIEPGGWGFGLFEADRISGVGKLTASPIHISNDPFPHQLSNPAKRATGTPIGSSLHDPVVLARGLHQLAPFENIVSDRLLHIHMFARLTGPDSGQCMPMVAGGDGHDIHRRVVHDAPHVLLDLGSLAADLRDGICLFATAPLVHIADRHNLNALDIVGVAYQGPSSTTSTDEGDPDPIVGIRPTVGSTDQ